MLAFRQLRPRPLHFRSLHSTPLCLSGHNKWSKIKQKKGANDLQRGALYSRTYKEIVLAVRNGGGPDAEQNTSLAAALRRAKEAGVPKDNIENALKKAAGGKDKGDTHLTFEVMGPGSVGMIVESLTDNPNRTVKFLNSILKDNGGRMADVKFLFKREGRVKFAFDDGPDAEMDVDRLADIALVEEDAEDFQIDDQEDGTIHVEFKCAPSYLHKLTSALGALKLGELVHSDLVYAPLEPLTDLDDETGEALDKLVQAIEDADDTLKVWTATDD